MNKSTTRILITLRDGGSLSRDICFGDATLRRKDGSVICTVRKRMLSELDQVQGYLRRGDTRCGTASYVLTDDGLTVARSIRNRVAP